MRAAEIFSLLGSTPFAEETRETLDMNRGLSEAVKIYVQSLNKIEARFLQKIKIQVKRLTPKFGAEIFGVDISKDLSNDLISEIRSVFLNLG